MMLFGWDEKYSVGIQSIDDQHKEIFRLLDQLFQGLRSGKAQGLIMQIIAELEDYTVIHFQKEELLFRQFNYADSEAHIKEHQHFIEKISALKEDAKANKLESSFELLHFLKRWVNHHILVVDMEYSFLFKENGLK